MYVKKLYPQIYNDILPLLGCLDFVEQAHLRNKIHNILIHPPITYFPILPFSLRQIKPFLFLPH